ncbi:hypothetical protein Q4489_04225 [Thalassotalea sp. 1_MG-2023]|uniref:hypothetical protein n=1 Tax=Thalassotalea sp. 1_MG-2023 TaxID=3062680 RepID=UPI0026E347E0|nr:hypothetical protein [Thalassotalea sp. 1_MG-2023]MDO6426203.1 hypothetical protein [Thalassotalea sp. 1_MG-2023]
MNNTNQPKHISKLARGVMRLNYLKSHGFTEQNNITQYRGKVKNNRLVQTCIHTKELAQSAKRLRAFSQRNIWAQ